MKRKTDVQDMPIGNLTRVRDFLPPPSQLVTSRQNVKVTISLNKSSVDFFKRKASQYHTKYQRMIRALLDMYVTQYSQ